MKIRILTPEKTVFDGEAESVALPGVDGGFEVLKGHVAILAGLKAGEARVIADKKELRFRIGGGFFEFAHDQGVVLADSVEG